MSAAGACGPEWILKSTSTELLDADLARLKDCACNVWPRLKLFAHRSISLESPADEKERFITEAFEEVLVAAMKALQNSKSPIVDLESYLARSFRHEIVRRAKKEKQIRRTVQYMPSFELDLLPENQCHSSWLAIDDKLQLDEIVGEMDQWTREAWISLTFGKSWKEIAHAMGMDTGRAKQRFRYQIKKIRIRMQRSSRRIGPEL